MNPNFGWENWSQNNQQPVNSNYPTLSNQNNQNFQGGFVMPSGWENTINNQYQPQQNQGNQMYSNPNMENSWGNSQPTPEFKNKNSWKEHSNWSVKPQNQTFNQTFNQTPYSMPQPTIQIQQPQINKQAMQNTNKLDFNKQYVIATVLDESMVIQISQSKGSQNKILLAKKNGQNNQKFKFNRGMDGRLVIYNQAKQVKQSNMNNIVVLNVQNCSPIFGAPIVASPLLSKSNLNPNQLWQLVPSTDGKQNCYFIQTFCGKCWDLCQWKTAHGTPIFQYDFNGGKNQLWVFKSL